MNQQIIQTIINRAVRLATKHALAGNPVAAITWIPATTASGNPEGELCIHHCGPLSGGQQAPWDK